MCIIIQYHVKNSLMPDRGTVLDGLVGEEDNSPKKR